MDNMLLPRQRDIDQRLVERGTSLAEWLAAERARDSFRGMSRTLRDLTGDTVSDQTLRRWYAQLVVAAA